MAGDEALGAEDASLGFEAAGEGVDSYHVRGFVVPRTVFAPIGGGDFFPRVIEGAIREKHFHRNFLMRDGGDGDDMKKGVEIGNQNSEARVVLTIADQSGLK